MLSVFKSNFKVRQFNFSIKEIFNMSTFYQGKLKVKDDELNLDLTLLGGQSFRCEINLIFFV